MKNTTMLMLYFLQIKNKEIIIIFEFLLGINYCFHIFDQRKLKVNIFYLFFKNINIMIFTLHIL